MGITGTEVSKSVASMVLADDNFSTIVVAVKEGRRTYNNIQNVIVYLLASNIAEILIVFISTLLGSLILYPLQLLWINLVTDTIPAIALGFEPESKDIMKQKPRKSDDKFFTPFLISRIVYPAILKSTFILLIYYIVEKSQIYSHLQAMTTAFIALVFAELLFAFSIRSDRFSILKTGIFSNTKLIIGIGFTIIIQLILIFTPSLSRMFKLVPLSLELYIVAISTAIVFVIVAEIIKKILVKKYIKD